MTVNTKRIAEFAKNNKSAAVSVLIFVVVFILLMAMNLSNIIDFARTYDLICVLKDFRTVTANPYGLSYLNMSGNNGMATGGSGDVLAGIIGALLAQGIKPMDAASFGVFIHGLAGDIAREKMGTHSIMASDIIDALKDVWKGIDYAE